MKVLVILELVPERTRRAIVDMTEEEYEYFSQAHNSSSVSDSINSINAISTIVTAFDNDINYYCSTDMEKKYLGKWGSDLDNADISEAEKLIHCYFYL